MTTNSISTIPAIADAVTTARQEHCRGQGASFGSTHIAAVRAQHSAAGGAPALKPGNSWARWHTQPKTRRRGSSRGGRASSGRRELQPGPHALREQTNAVPLKRAARALDSENPSRKKVKKALAPVASPVRKKMMVQNRPASTSDCEICVSARASTYAEAGKNPAAGDRDGIYCM